jgi:hypothetical protein
MKKGLSMASWSKLEQSNGPWHDGMETLPSRAGGTQPENRGIVAPAAFFLFSSATFYAGAMDFFFLFPQPAAPISTEKRR